jgi:hypothetical protein
MNEKKSVFIEYLDKNIYVFKVKDVFYNVRVFSSCSSSWSFLALDISAFL